MSAYEGFLFDKEASKSSDEESSSNRPVKRKRNRASLSCAECRRLKTKCDRQVPCAGCVKRGCADLCPNGSSGSLRNLLNDRQRLEARVKELESRLSGAGPSNVSSSLSSLPHGTSSAYTNADLSPSTINLNNVPSAGPAGVPGPSSSSSNTHSIAGISPLGYSQNNPFSDASPSNNNNNNQEATLATAAAGPYMSSWESNRPASLAPYSSVRDSDAPGGLRDEGRSRRIILPFDNSGTLVVTAGGRSKFLGPGAASQQLREGANETLRSRFPSPINSPPPELRDRPAIRPMYFGYPAKRRPDMAHYIEARDSLPLEEEVQVLVDCYFRYVAWNSTPIIRAEMDKVLESIFHPSSSADPDTLTVEYQKLALVYIVIAFGCMMNMEHPPNDPMAEKYFYTSQQCLFNGRFLVYNTIVGLQALTITAKFLSYTDAPGRHDLSWQLWGIAIRMCSSMGLHRDGEQWNLSSAELNQRRRVFWETFNLDIWRSFSYDRPPGMSPRHFNTKYPADLGSGPNGEPGFFQVKFGMTRLAYDVLDESLRVDPSPFPRLTELWDSFSHFEANIPYYLRCRAALKAMVSRYQTIEAAEAESPPPSRTDFKNTFRQHALALNMSGSVFTLLRPYFVQALHSFPDDPTKSPYAKAYLAVIERSSMMVAILKSIHMLFPWASTRHWFFWADCFSAAICLATVCIVSPQNPLVGLCLSDVSDVIAMYESIRDAYPGGALRENLKCLQYLLRQIYARANPQESDQSPDQLALPFARGQQSTNEDDQELKDDPMDLVGWKTRLVQISEVRAGNRVRPKIQNGKGPTTSSVTAENGTSTGGTKDHGGDTDKEGEDVVGGPEGRTDGVDLSSLLSKSAPAGQDNTSNYFPDVGTSDLTRSEEFNLSSWMRDSDSVMGSNHDMTSLLLQQLLEAPLGQGPNAYDVSDPMIASLGNVNERLEADRNDPFYDFGIP